MGVFGVDLEGRDADQIGRAGQELATGSGVPTALDDVELGLATRGTVVVDAAVEAVGAVGAVSTSLVAAIVVIGRHYT